MLRRLARVAPQLMRACFDTPFVLGRTELRMAAKAGVALYPMDGADAETLLFAAARDDHVHTVIEPALAQGIWVLCDRFADSTRAYQGRLGDVLPGVLNAMERVTIGDLKPDLTVILDIPVEVGMQRAAARRGSGAPDRFEAEDVAFHQKLRDAYREIAANDPNRCVLIDANADANTVAAKVWAALRDRVLSADMTKEVSRA